MFPGVLVALAGKRAWGMTWLGGAQKKPHPEPRPGITASRVVAAKDLGDDRKAIEAFDMVREIPHVVDGIRCSCGCEGVEGYYSLLSCFEKDGMAAHCETCQAEARMIHKLHREGRTLAQIRAALDAGVR
jgi:hypothetical protein